MILKNIIFTEYEGIKTRLFNFKSIYEINGDKLTNLYYYYVIWNFLYQFKLHYYFPVRLTGKIYVEYNNNRKFKTILYSNTAMNPTDVTIINCLSTFTDLKNIVCKIDNDNTNLYEKIYCDGIYDIELFRSNKRKSINKMFEGFIQFEKPILVKDILLINNINKNIDKIVITYFSDDLNVLSKMKTKELMEHDLIVDLDEITQIPQ
jgi:hypothetical protein